MADQPISRRKLLYSLGAAAAAVASGDLLGVHKVEAQSAIGPKIRESQVVMSTVDILRSMTGAPEATYYYIANPGQAGLFYYDPHDHSSSDNTGTVIVSVQGHRFKRLLENENQLLVSWFGVRADGEHDDSQAIQAAVNSLQHGQTLFFEAGKPYLMTRPIKISSPDANVHLVGSDTVLLSSGNDILHIQDCESCVIEGLNFAPHPADGNKVNLAIQAHRVKQLVIEKCQFQQQFISCENGSIRIEHCQFNGKYQDSKKANTLCRFTNAPQVTMNHNQFEIIGMEKLLHIENSDHAVFKNNRMMLTTDTKTATVMSIHGAWNGTSNIASTGPTKASNNREGSLTAFFTKLSVSNNDIHLAAPHSSTTPLQFSHWHEVCIDHNTFTKQYQSYGGEGLEISHSERIVIADNRYHYASLHILGGGVKLAENGQGQPFQINVRNNMFYSSLTSGAVRITSCKTLERVVINENHFSSVREQMGIVEQYIQIIDSMIASFCVQNNTGFFRWQDMSFDSAMNATNIDHSRKIVINKSSIIRREINGNSWQNGSTYWNPGLVARGRSVTTSFALYGATLGDSVHVAHPYNLQGCQLSAFVTMQDQVTLTLYNYTDTDKTFYPAEWRVKLV